MRVDATPTDAELGELVALAARCRETDGGMPLAADPSFVRRRWAAPGSTGRRVRDEADRLIAAVVVRPSGEDGATVATLVDPGVREGDLAAELLDWGLQEARRRGGAVVVETESLTAGQADLFAARGLRQSFAEDVLRIDPRSAPPPSWPAEALLHTWGEGTARRFFALYESAFRERPGFPGDPAETWIGDLEDDDEFRPGWSVLVELPGLGDAGFVTAAVGWIDQVGVSPAARGRGLGAALTAEALARMRADGATEAWLNVNVDNPGATSVYLRLGFTVSARRARFEA